MSTTTLTAPERHRLTLPEVLADSRVIAARQLRKVSRKPTLIVFALIQPVMLLLLFRYVFGGAIDTDGVNYLRRRRGRAFGWSVPLLASLALTSCGDDPNDAPGGSAPPVVSAEATTPVGTGPASSGQLSPESEDEAPGGADVSRSGDEP